MGKKAIGTVIFTIGLMSVTMGAMFFQQIGSGMAGYWKCDDVAAPTTDSSGVVNDGAWSGTVSSLTGAANTPAATAFSTGCLNFNSSTAQVSIPGTAALTITGDFTVAFWMYPNADAGDYQRLVGKGNITDRTFGVWRNPNADHHILFQQYNAGSPVINFQSAATTPNTAWTHVACRIQGTTGTIFINGASDATGPRTGTPNGVQSDPVTFAYAGFHTSFPGRLDDVRMYNRALSDADILALSTGGQGPAAPTGLTATGVGTQIDLSWSGAGTVYNVKRATVSGGPYTTVASNVGGTTYSDTTVSPGQTYYYVVSGVTYGEGPNSNEASATTGPVTATPNTGLFTNENGASTTFTIKFNLPAPSGGSTVTVVTDTPSEGVVSIAGLITTPVPNGLSFDVAAGATPSVVVTVTGVDDSVVDGPQAYKIHVTATNIAIPIPDVNCTNNDNDIQGLTFSRVAGLTTTESGGQDSFDVTLNRQPFNNVSFTLLSSNPLEGTVVPGSLTFTATTGQAYNPATGVGGWNVAHTVTVTGVDDPLLDFTVPYTIVTGALTFVDTKDQTAFANAGVTSAPNVACVNLDNEVPPALPHVWGGGGCGLLGLELLIPFAVFALRRRGRR